VTEPFKAQSSVCTTRFSAGTHSSDLPAAYPNRYRRLTWVLLGVKSKGAAQRPCLPLRVVGHLARSSASVDSSMSHFCSTPGSKEMLLASKTRCREWPDGLPDLMDRRQSQMLKSEWTNRNEDANCETALF